VAGDAFIVDAVRSPIGRRGGGLASIRGDELAAQVLNALVERVGVAPGEVEDVQLGCVTQIGEQGWNLGRMVPLVAGWPETVGGTTVDRQCGSSMQTNFNAAAAIWSGQLDLVVSAGVEMMSRVPMGSNGGDLSPLLLERWQIVPQGISAEVIAEEWGLSREELDAYSLESHRRALAAADGGLFERELVPVTVGETVVAADEGPRRDTSAEKLAALPPAFLPDGRVTAGNSSQIVDGAAAVLVASEAAVERLGLEPRARFVSFGLAGVDPHRMLHGNPEACAKALGRAGLSWDDIAVVEVNEAFASVVLQFARDAGLEHRMADVNPNGGGISLGHPLGATGARVTATLLGELERRGDDVHRLRAGAGRGGRTRLRGRSQQAVTCPSGRASGGSTRGCARTSAGAAAPRAGRRSPGALAAAL
jgi:acetyl-CoA acyltransferase